MSTTPNEPPSREAVEAAMRYATADNTTHANHAESTLEVLYGQCAWDTEHTGMMVGRILAAEVQRLRAWQHQAKEEMEMHGGKEVFACLNDL